jgi:SAM-dependent methyltransferase
VSQWVRGRRVLDIGCGRNLQGYGFLAVGARSYTGLDPTLDLDDDKLKDSRDSWSHFEKGGLTPRELMKRFPRIEFMVSTIEDFAPREKFGTIVMHNVTEHLMNIEDTFARLPEFLEPGGQLVFRHPNYYCWHGHHMKPRTIDEIDPACPKQQLVMDWAHAAFDPVRHEWIGRTQNRIRPDELRALVEQHFVLETWDEQESPTRKGIERLTPEILAKYPGFTRREFAVERMFVVARRK